MRVRRALVAVAALAAVAASCPPSARAQGDQLKPIRLYLGAFFPSKSETSDRIGSAVFSWGLSYDIPQKKPSPVKLAVYFDGVWASSDEFLNRRIRFHYFAFGPEARYYLGQKGESGTPQKSRFYVGGGFGLYIITAQITDGSGFFISTLDNDLKLGGKLLAGVEFGKSFLVEGDYTWPGSSAANGWNARVGFRF
jgi:hypothetical protein